ncbi:MAG: hypothetical protein KAJ09_00475, partial [Deltaproteobacteria bacterium]|nr:hypothetical protein [Deltaproteobacteria bacterium]
LRPYNRGNMGVEELKGEDIWQPGKVAIGHIVQVPVSTNLPMDNQRRMAKREPVEDRGNGVRNQFLGQDRGHPGW